MATSTTDIKFNLLTQTVAAQNMLLESQGKQIRVLFAMIRELTKETKKCSKQESLPL